MPRPERPQIGPTIALVVGTVLLLAAAAAVVGALLAVGATALVRP